MNYYCQCNNNAKLINSLMIIHSSLIIKMKYRISLFLKFEFQTIFIIFSSNLNSQKNQMNILFTYMIENNQILIFSIINLIKYTSLSSNFLFIFFK